MSKVKAEIEETAKQEIISQWGVTAEEGSLYRVERGFHLNTKLGPPIPVKKGDIVRLSEKSWKTDCKGYLVVTNDQQYTPHLQTRGISRDQLFC